VLDNRPLRMLSGQILIGSGRLSGPTARTLGASRKARAPRAVAGHRGRCRPLSSGRSRSNAWARTPRPSSTVSCCGSYGEAEIGGSDDRGSLAQASRDPVRHSDSQLARGTPQNPRRTGRPILERRMHEASRPLSSTWRPSRTEILAARPVHLVPDPARELRGARAALGTSSPPQPAISNRRQQ